MYRSLTIAALLLAGCGTSSVEGKLVDAFTGEVVTGVRVIAKATGEDASMTCQSFDSEVDEQGGFAFMDLCTGTPYELRLDDDSLWLADHAQVPDGGIEGPVEAKVWRVPKGSGVYKLAGSKLEALKTATDVKKEKIKGSEDTVRYPARRHKSYPLIAKGEYLVLVGEGNIQDLQPHPLIASGERKFGDDDVTITMDPWDYVGVRFEDDKTYETVEAKPDTSTFVDKSGADRAARFIPGEALPAGRYAWLKEKDRRMYILDFQAPPAPAAPE